MHDIFEGIARYDMALILNYIIFDLFNFKKLKQPFDYRQIEIGNLGPEIRDTNIKNCSLIMSASVVKSSFSINNIGKKFG